MKDAVLELPHPRMAERKFVLIPLAEIAANAPLYQGKTVKELLAATMDDSNVSTYGTLEVARQGTVIG